MHIKNPLERKIADSKLKRRVGLQRNPLLKSVDIKAGNNGRLLRLDGFRLHNGGECRNFHGWQACLSGAFPVLSIPEVVILLPPAFHWALWRSVVIPLVT